MDGMNKRRHARLMHQARIRLIVPVLSNMYVVDMRDFSESGLFLLSPNEAIPPIGSFVEVQTTEFEDAPIQTARVVRIEEGVGFGVEFVSPEASNPDV